MDWTRLRELHELDGDASPSEVAGLVVIFRGSAARRVAELHAALASGDLSACADAAHTLRGSAATFGASRLAHAADLIEHACADGESVADIARRVAAVESDLSELLAALASPPDDLL